MAHTEYLFTGLGNGAHQSPTTTRAVQPPTSAQSTKWQRIPLTESVCGNGQKVKSYSIQETRHLRSFVHHPIDSTWENTPRKSNNDLWKLMIRAPICITRSTISRVRTTPTQLSRTTTTATPSIRAHSQAETPAKWGCTIVCLACGLTCPSQGETWQADQEGDHHNSQV